jgi:flagellar basal-body rod protein FlgG
MSAQQLSIDTIGNNIANVNTTGFKRERLEFQSLLYETLQNAGTNPELVGNRPNNLQVGHGVRPVATTRNFAMGSIEPTANPTHFALQGSGFFMVDRGDDNRAFTRDGSFALSVDGGTLTLVTSAGYPVLDIAGNAITFDETVNMTDVAVSHEGVFTARGANGETIALGMQLAVVQFPNRQGLEAIGGNLFIQTATSGTPLMEDEGEVTRSHVIQNHIERSNVQIAEEMVNMIVTQRAFELNSRIIQTSDDMLQQANNLRR